MNSVKIRDVILGEGIPKICVPVTGHTEEEIRLRLREAADTDADVVEWRADWYDGVFEKGKLSGMLKLLREFVGETPLLVTFRTREEGGEQEISQKAYEDFLSEVLYSGQADMIDAELFRGENLLTRICREAHQSGTAVVASSHDFEKTPEKDEILRRLCRMQECGADVLKMAAMPQNPQDVLTLLSATWEMKEKYAKQPLITMSMGKTGVVSRMCGEIFGSALTFGSAGTASAPGQIPVSELRNILEIFHEEHRAEKTSGK